MAHALFAEALNAFTEMLAEERQEQDNRLRKLADFNETVIIPQILAHLPDVEDTYFENGEYMFSVCTWRFGDQQVELAVEEAIDDECSPIVHVQRWYVPEAVDRDDCRRIYGKRFLEKIESNCNCIVSKVLQQIIIAQHAQIVQRLHPERNADVETDDSDDEFFSED